MQEITLEVIKIEKARKDGYVCATVKFDGE